MMSSLLHCILLLLAVFVEVAASQSVDDFTYNGFSGANVSLDGIAEISPNGLLKLTNSSRQGKAHAFYSFPLRFKGSPGGNVSSFSTTFVFAIVSEFSDLGSQGMAFTLSPTRGRPGALGFQYLALFNATDNGNPSNHVVAVELDTVLNVEFGDINENHVGIDVNNLRSLNQTPAAYFSEETGRYANLTLISGHPMQVWIEYDGAEKLLSVTLHPTTVPTPGRPLLSTAIDLSTVILDTMYVGFSSATPGISANHYIQGWSFKMNGKARELDPSRLPPLPRHKRISKLLVVMVALGTVLFLAAVASGAAFYAWRKKFEEIRDDWEANYASHRFSYRELYMATKGFSDKRLLGAGGFGKVYRGSISRKSEIAVKKVSHESRQGMREFIAEIVSIGQLRHRNLVPLLGYCRRRRKGELLLVYEFMLNGSLDKHLFDQSTPALGWSQRFRIIKGIALALHFLHEGWEQVVIHRDVKASNVLLDGEMNGRLGDFGLARLYDHGSDPRTTHVVGTMGYLAPEVPRTGKATTSADVFSFGALVLEIACGRKTVETQGPPDQASEVVLVDWVSQCWRRGAILEASDLKLVGDYVVEEMELALRLGLICSHPEPAMRPSMRQVIQYLEEDAPLPEMSKDGDAVPALRPEQGCSDVNIGSN